MPSSVKKKAYKQRIQQVATTAAPVSAVYASMTAAALAGLKRSVLNLQQDLFSHDGALLSDPSVRYLKEPYCLESARAYLTISYITSASTSHRDSDDGRVIPSRQGFPKRSGGLIPQDGSLSFEPYVRSLKEPSCLNNARASITTSDIASASTSHCASGSGEVSMSGQGVPKRSGCLISQDGSLHFK